MKINYWNLLAVVILAAAALVIPFDVWAGGADPFGATRNRVCETWKQSRTIVYVIGGVATLSLGVLAFFGRFKWTTFFALVGGLFMIAIFDQILGFATAQGSGVNGVVTSTGCS